MEQVRRLVTELPGPTSRALHARRTAAVTCAVGSPLPAYVERAGGAVLTGGDGPRMHHVAFAAHERAQILHLCGHLGAIRQSDKVERVPGRHGVFHQV